MSRPALGAGWTLHHLTDRCIELRKDDHAYRRLTGRDGFVRVRIEPEMTRAMAIETALTMARRNDELLAERVAAQMLPSKAALARYQGKQLRLSRVFGTPEDPERIGVKR